MTTTATHPSTATTDAAATEPLLRLDNLRVQYTTAHGVLPAVQGVSLSIHPGEVVAIVGESGSGKSTVAHSIVRLLAGNARIVGGTAQWRGLDLLTQSEKSLRNIRGAEIGFVPQDPTVSLNPVKRVGEQVAESLRRHGIATGRDAAAQAVEILRLAGLDNAERNARQYPHELSGGMRQRVLIAIAIACKPRLIIADEPTSALDVSVQKTVLDHLDRLISENGTSVLMVTHDLGIAADRADRILVMQRGRIVEAGTAETILTNPAHEYTRSLIEAAPSLNSHRLVAPAGSVSWRQDAPASDAPAPALLSVVGLNRSFGDDAGSSVTAADDVSFDLFAGKTLALVGESGSGKTTTARIVAHFERADSGTVRFEGRDITGLRGADLRTLRRRIQFVHQNPYASLDPRYTVRKTLEEAIRASGRHTPKQRLARAKQLLEQVSLAETTLSRRPRELSGGQRQRVAIARALAMEPTLLILDEPVSALDVSVQSGLLRLLTRLQYETGLTYLFITHDLAVVQQIADDVLVLRSGTVVERGETRAVLANPQHPYTVQLVDSIPGSAFTADALTTRSTR